MKKITILAAAMMLSVSIYAANSASGVTEEASQPTTSSIGNTVVAKTPAPKVETKTDIQSPVGYWMTVSDDEVGGKPVVQSIVQIMNDPKDKSKLIGKILVPFVNVVDGEKQIPDLLCTHCTGDLKDKPVVGLQIITGAEKSGSADGSDGVTYKEGEIMDPSNGKTYTLKMWTEENGKELKVRGYIMFFYRTQTWYRVDAADAQKYGAECGIASGAKSYKYVGADSKISNKDLWKTCSNIPKP